MLSNKGIESCLSSGRVLWRAGYLNIYKHASYIANKTLPDGRNLCKLLVFTILIQILIFIFISVHFSMQTVHGKATQRVNFPLTPEDGTVVP